MESESLFLPTYMDTLYHSPTYCLAKYTETEIDTHPQQY